MLIFYLRRGAVAQLGERLNGIQEVRGSIPLSSTIAILTQLSLKRLRFLLSPISHTPYYLTCITTTL